MSASPRFWEALFAATEGGDLRVEMRLLRKRGQPFLLLPVESRAAVASLQLYPAQTPRARVARAVLRWCLGVSLPIGTENVSFAASSEDSFVQLLASLTGGKKREFPQTGILAGNPASDGQRFLILVFDADQRPVAVVKAGLSERAKTLVEKEESLLRALEGKISGIPRVRGTCQSSRLRALALDFFPGDSPRRRHEGAMPPLLRSWVDQQRKIALREAADWTRLEQACAANNPYLTAVQRVRDWPLHPVIQHGDFAPWNIKVSRTGAWTVLDWERGELAGIPGWDWFHYVIQPAILVEHLGLAGLFQQVESLLASAPFQQYAARAGINGCERELVLAYLLHAVEVIKPSEGLAVTRGLLASLAAGWRLA